MGFWPTIADKVSGRYLAVRASPPWRGSGLGTLGVALDELAGTGISDAAAGGGVCGTLLGGFCRGVFRVSPVSAAVSPVSVVSDRGGLAGGLSIVTRQQETPVRRKASWPAKAPASIGSTVAPTVSRNSANSLFRRFCFLAAVADMIATNRPPGRSSL